jgi:YidC/Oxa1 family membrane protein insertase
VGGAAGPAAGGQAAATPAEPLLTGVVETVERIAIPWDKSSAPGERAPDGVNGLRFTSPALTLAPGGSADLSMQVYAGPMSREAIAADPAAARVGLDALLYYSLGGPCAFCTFQTLAQFLRSFLGALQGYVTHDWALAVMLLVVCVRTILHPVTRWSQTSLYRFSKQMSRVAPKQKAIQEKYKNDPQRLREELMRLNREEGVSYAGALGCVPMFLQTPVWIALYAMIFFTFALRHEAAFFGLFQHLTGGKWAFLSDLAEPDNFVNFHDAFGGPADGYYVPLLSSMMGPIQGINIIPLILGVVFYIQQKYLTPPPTTTLTPEQEQQQKIMKVVSVVMFPLFMYNAPAALSLYFMTNSTLGILESKWIRHHAEEADKRREAENAVRARSVGTSMLDRKGQPKKEGFLDKLQRMALEAQQMREQQQRGQGKKK